MVSVGACLIGGGFLALEDDCRTDGTLNAPKILSPLVIPPPIMETGRGAVGGSGAMIGGEEITAGMLLFVAFGWWPALFRLGVCPIAM